MALQHQILDSEEHQSPTASNLARSCFVHNLLPVYFYFFPKAIGHQLPVLLKNKKQKQRKGGDGVTFKLNVNTSLSGSVAKLKF